jgi:hypothetical protein
MNVGGFLAVGKLKFFCGCFSEARRALSTKKLDEYGGLGSGV